MAMGTSTPAVAATPRPRTPRMSDTASGRLMRRQRDIRDTIGSNR